MGKDALSIRTAQCWFNRFNNDDFELDDLPHTRRPLEMDMHLLKKLIEEDPRLTTQCLAEPLRCSHITLEIYLHELGKTWNIWSLDITLFVIISASTQSLCLYGINDISS